MGILNQSCPIGSLYASRDLPGINMWPAGFCLATASAGALVEGVVRVSGLPLPPAASGPGVE